MARKKTLKTKIVSPTVKLSAVPPLEDCIKAANPKILKKWKKNEREILGPYADKFWEIMRRDDQVPPCETGWTTWLLLGGRGAGKTRAGAEWIRTIVRQFQNDHQGQQNSAPMRIALIAETYADAREIMIDGPSGLRSIGFSDERPSYETSRRRLVWPGGAVAHCFSAEDPDGLRGYQFNAAWADEMCKWRYPEETWSNLQLALRLGDCPRQVVTTTPRPMALLKRLMASDKTAITRATSYDNRDNLAESFFTEIASVYEGTAIGRQELMGELIDDVAGALWSWSMIEASRIAKAPLLDRIVVAVDPPVGSGPDADECGIIIAGVCEHDEEPSAYILGDWSVQGLSPRGWGERAIAAYHEFQADRLVVEVNQGGEMVRQILLQIDASVALRPVHATRGKRVRAEPVAVLYERGRVRHVGAFSKLEDQLTNFTGLGRGSSNSPDRLDALVWALTDLMLRGAEPKPGVRRIH